MPALVAAIGPVASLIGGSGFGALLTNALIGTAINFAVGAVIDWITPDEPANDNVQQITGVELQFRSGARVPVSAIMGMKDTPGQLAYHNSYGADNEYLQLLFIDGNAEHDALYAVLVDNASTALTGSNADARGRVIEKFRVNADGAEDPGGTPYAWVKYYTGAVGQTADAELVARANPVGRWTSACTMTATAYRVVTLRFNPKVFGGAIPQMRAVWRGLKQYDRRKDSTQPGGSGAHRWGQPETYEWSENPAVCQDTWRRGIWVNGVRLLGLGVSEFDCHHAGIVSAANVSDEDVYYADTGRTLPRYVLGIEVKDGTDPISMMRLFEGAMGGYGAEYGGAYTPLPAQTMASVLTLTDRDRVAGDDVLEQTRMSPLETKTAFHGQFLSADIGWMPDDYDIRFDAVAEGQEGGRRAEPFDATFVRHRETASMLAEIKVRRDRYSALEVATYGPRAADLKPGQVITRNSELLGTVQMMVLGVQRQPRKRYRLSLRRWNNAIVPTTTDGFMPLPVEPLPAPVPVRLTHPLAFLAVAIEQVSGDVKVPAIRVTWTPITDQTVNRVIVKYWPTANPTDVRYASSDDPASGIMVLEGVAPETPYKLVATIVTMPARITTWTNEASVTTTSLVVAAGAVEDDSITIGKLVQELRNRLDVVVGDIPARIAQLEAEIAEQAAAGFTQSATNKKRTSLLKAQVGGAIAAVIREEIARTEADAAMAVALEQVLAQVDGLFASGLIRFEARVAGGGAEATVAIMVRVGDEDDFIDSGVFIKATKVGLVTSSEILLQADKLYITDGINTSDAFSFDAATGELVLKSLRFEMLKSIDGSSNVQNGLNGDFSFG